MIVELRNQRSRLGVSPENGASLVYLEVDDAQVLREGDPAGDPRQAGGFPLAPFCNRLLDGQLSHGGRLWNIAPNVPGVADPAHGYAWQMPWSVEKQSMEAVSLSQLSPDVWPWPYRLHYRIKLENAGVRLTLTLTNHSKRMAPVGLGIHPYFKIGSDCILATHARTACASSPFESGAAGGSLRTRVGDLPVQDFCLEGWSRTADLMDQDRLIAITARNTPRLQVFRPQEEGLLCLEPVTNRPNYGRSGSVGLKTLRPGATTSITLNIRVIAKTENGPETESPGRVFRGVGATSSGGGFSA